MNDAERFPRLSAALLKMGTTAEARRLYLEAAAADLASPPVQGQAQGADVDEGPIGTPQVQNSWAKALGSTPA
jgi:hypothetical protein